MISFPCVTFYYSAFKVQLPLVDHYVSDVREERERADWRLHRATRTRSKVPTLDGETSDLPISISCSCCQICPGIMHPIDVARAMSNDKISQEDSLNQDV